MPPVWLPTKLLDAAEQTDFMAGVQPYLQGLQEQVTQGVAGLDAAVTDVGRQAMQLLAPPKPQAQPQAIEPFSLPSFEQITGSGTAAPVSGPVASASPAATPAAGAVPRNSTDPTPFTLPTFESLTGFPETVRRNVQTTLPSAPTAGAATATTAAPSEFNAYVRQAAGQRGLDPDQVLKVVGKEGPTGWGSVGTFNTGSSFGPLQLHYGGGSNPKQGMGDDFTKATGIDLRKVDPNTPEGIAAHQRAVDFALDRLSTTGDYREWYGADPALGSRMTKVKRIDPVAPPQTASPAPPVGTYTKDLQVNQITQGAAEGLTTAEALAVCGPAAAVAFARANGRNPTLREAKELGSSLGVWNVEQGMAGPASQVQLLEKMGVPARLQQGADEATISREVQAGRPVIVDSPGHYWVAQSYDPQTRTFDFGESAKVLKASRGRSRFRLDELAGLGMGAPRASIFMGAAR